MAEATPSETRSEQEPLRWSTAAIALLFVAAIAAGGAFSALVRYDLVGFGHLPRAAVFGVFVLLLLNGAAMKLRRRRLFTTGQLAFVYVAILVMAGFPGQQLVTYLYLGLISSPHYATPENKYEETFFDYIRDWMVTSKDPTSDSVEWAFYGLPPGQTIPWSEWVFPLLAWTPLLLALLLLHTTTAALIRRRWVDNERVLFPLAHVPVEMITYAEKGHALPRIFHHWLGWAFFLIPIIVYSKNALSYYFPTIPETDLTRDIGPAFSGRPWSLLNYFPYYIYFEMMGVTYLVADDVGFSMWFFWIARRLAMVARDACGLAGHQEWFQHQGIGAYIFLGTIYLWAARRHLLDVLRKALLGAKDVDDSMEPASYRVQLGGFILALLVIFIWGRAAGAVVWHLALVFALYIVSLIVLTRLVSEAGLFAVWLPTTPPETVVVRALGSATIGPRSITAMSYIGWKIQDAASCTMANIMQGYKVADLAHIRPRANLGLIVAALVLALFASHPSAIYAIYSRTVPGLGWWPRNAGGGLPHSISTLIRAPNEYTLGNAGNMCIGAAIVSALYCVRQRFLWWPFHPLAYAALMGPQFMGDRYGFSILVGWTVRKLVHRFGDHRGYLLFRHAAVGIIAGNAIVLLVWTIINYFYPIPQVLIIE